MKLRSNIIIAGKWLIVAFTLLLMLSIVLGFISIPIMLFSLFTGLKMLGIAILSSIVLVIFIMTTKSLLDWAIETSEYLLSDKIKQLHAEMDAIINQFKKDSETVK